MFKFLILFFLWSPKYEAVDLTAADRICGKWISANKDYIVQVYRNGNTYSARTLWFKNKDTSKAMDEWTDSRNPDPALRSRKLLGMDIMTDLAYSQRSDSWENGKIYDASNGHVWSAFVRLNKDGSLKLTAFWHFKFIGKTVLFSEYKKSAP